MRLVAASVVCGALALGGCAASAPKPAAPKPAAATSRPESAAERLALALRSIPRPEPVLSALPASVQRLLRARYEALDPERRAAVHADEGAPVESFPLLHLASGGTSPRALYALATSSAASDELAAIPGESGQPADLSRVALVRELARRAALHFLRDRAADVRESGKQTALACRLVARAAQTAERPDLSLLARELLVEKEPTPENRLDWANALARAGEPELATLRVAEARADRHQPAPASTVARVERLIEAARTVKSSAPRANNLEFVLSHARAWLRLGRPAEAERELNSVAAERTHHLGIAAASAEASIGSPACPDLPEDVGSPALCSIAFRSSARVQQALQWLELGWQSGNGRDDEAVEIYAALAHVVPWMHETALGIADGTLTPEQSAAAYASLRQQVQGIAAVQPHLAGLALFLELLRSKSSTRAWASFSDVEAAALAARAAELAAVDSSQVAQAGVLGVAAALSHQRDVSALVSAVPTERTPATLRVARASLELWLAASNGDREQMEAARGQLAAIMNDRAGESLERARLVLGVTEADALLSPSERAYQLLSRVAGQLLNDDVPPDLALRAVLDAAGALAHGQRIEQAQKLLKSVAHADVPSTPRLAEPMTLIKGYALVLDAQGAPASSLPERRARLESLAGEPASAVSAVWFALWLREFDARKQEAECANKRSRTCPFATRLRQTAEREIDARLGPQASAIVRRGALPSGSFQAGFRFSLEYGLEPLLGFDPSFLALGLPPIASE